MKDLLAFQIWAVEKGHYQTVDAIKRYLRMKANERTENTSKDHKEAGEGKLRSDQPNNS